MNEEINISDYLRPIKNKWWVTLSIFLVAELTSMLITVRQHKTYESTTTIFPPKVVEIDTLSTAILKIKRKVSIGLSPTQSIIAIFKSKRMASDIVEKFGLLSLYNTQFKSDAVKKLENSTNISVSKEGAVSVTVSSIDPKLAAEIANFYVENLDKINNELKLFSVKPVVTVIDPAIPADRPSGPKVKLCMFITGLLSILVGILVSFPINSIERRKES
ncbi:MAG: Wzz/FepE/Etk N-terminal domain-containing protein [bacterium]|nr:Wzz/FepE/Etk N-terminal domain-containing protein [bacterium]